MSSRIILVKAALLLRMQGTRREPAAGAAADPSESVALRTSLRSPGKRMPFPNCFCVTGRPRCPSREDVHKVLRLSGTPRGNREV